MTKTVIEELVAAAQATLTEQRGEFARGEIEDLDRLEDAIAAYRASVEPEAPLPTLMWEPCSVGGLWTCRCGASYCSPPWSRDAAARDHRVKCKAVNRT